MANTVQGIDSTVSEELQGLSRAVYDFERNEIGAKIEYIVYMNKAAIGRIAIYPDQTGRVMIRYGSSALDDPEKDSRFRKIALRINNQIDWLNKAEKLLNLKGGGTTQPAETSAGNPWDKIPDCKWDRLAVKWLYEGYTSPEIASKIGNLAAKTVDNRLSVLRSQYDFIETREEIEREKRSK